MRMVSLCALVFSGVVWANDASVSNAAAEKVVTVDENVVNNTSIDGFYAGLGVQYSHWNNKIKATDGVDAAGGATQANIDISYRQIDNFGGTILIGYGKASDIYFSGEVLFDMRKSDKIDGTYTDRGRVYPYCAQVNGVIPSIAARVGCCCPLINGFVYTKLGISYVRAEFQEKDPRVEHNLRKMNKITPTISLGFEKIFRGLFNFRCELDYRVQIKSTSQTIFPGTAKYNVENRLKGLTFRIMAIYKF